MLSRRRAVATAIASVGIAVLTLTGCSGPSVATLQEVAVAGESGPSTFVDGAYESSLVTMKITGSAVIAPGEQGNETGDAPVIAYWYETTNVAGQATDPLTAWLTHFRAFQNNADVRAELVLAPSPDASFADTQTSPITKGATAMNVVAYQLSNPSDPVELLAVDSTLTEVGAQDFPVR